MYELILISIILVGLLLTITWFLYVRMGRLAATAHQDQALTTWLQSMQQSIEQTHAHITTVLTQHNQHLSNTLTNSSQMVSKQLANASTVVADVSKELGKMNELGRSMKELQLLLQSPKLRGNIGEEILSDMLGQVFPSGSFMLQHAFKSGEKVDAAVKTSAGVLSIDAKFPMENFQRMAKSDQDKEREQYQKAFITDVKKHIKTIASKYISPDEGTVDFALMYIPSETVFYEIANISSLLEYARLLRVYPVSPNTLYVHLQTILLSFEGQHVEEKSKQVIKLLKSLQHDFVKVDESMQVLGKHLGNASNQYTNASTQFTRLGQKLNYQDLLEEPQ